MTRSSRASSRSSYCRRDRHDDHVAASPTPWRGPPSRRREGGRAELPQQACPSSSPRQLVAAGLTARILEHLQYTVIAVFFSALIAVPLGMIIGHTGRGTFLVVTGVNALLAAADAGRCGYCSVSCCGVRRTARRDAADRRRAARQRHPRTSVGAQLLQIVATATDRRSRSSAHEVPVALESSSAAGSERVRIPVRSPATNEGPLRLR